MGEGTEVEGVRLESGGSWSPCLAHSASQSTKLKRGNLVGPVVEMPEMKAGLVSPREE